MSVVFRAYNGKVAIWEKPTSGDVMAPFDDPVAHFDLIRFHVDCQYLSNQLVSGTITVNHTLLAGEVGTGYSVSNGTQGSTFGAISNGQVRITDIDIYTHSLGYAPLFQLHRDGRIVSPATVIQNPTGQTRRISAYATTSKIFIREVAISSLDDLPAISVDYKLIIFRNPTADPSKPTLHIKASTGMILGKGKVTDENRPLRRASVTDTDKFYIPIGRTVDIKNGAIRNISPAGVIDYGFYTGGFATADLIEVTY